jgi:predicted Rossmann fold nucleotide-binding protein DprA/Smf involved in DNA uptake
MNPICVQKDDPSYPAILRASLGERAPKRLFVLGNPELLRSETLALFCSVKCPGRIILKTYDLAKALRDAGVPVIGGFHTPMEKECLALLLRGTQPIIVCPARGLERIRPSAGVQHGIEAGRVLLISMFGSGHRRATAELSDQRNRLAAALAGMAFVSHAAPGGKTEALCREILAMGKPLFTIDAPENANLLAVGAKALAVEDVSLLRQQAAGQSRRPEGVKCEQPHRAPLGGRL